MASHQASLQRNGVRHAGCAHVWLLFAMAFYVPLSGAAFNAAAMSLVGVQYGHNRYFRHYRRQPSALSIVTQVHGRANVLRTKLATRMQYDDGEITEREVSGLGDLSILGAIGKLRAGVPSKTRELAKTNRINESYEIQCEKASYLLKINRRLAAHELFEGSIAVVMLTYTSIAVVMLTCGAVQRRSCLSAGAPLCWYDVPKDSSHRQPPAWRQLHDTGVSQLRPRRAAGCTTQFTCFTSTKVRIGGSYMTQEFLSFDPDLLQAH